MVNCPEIETERLRMRAWALGDLEPFARMNRDPRVMEHFPALLSREESDRLASRIARQLVEQPFGLWAVEVRGGAPFIGFVGLSVPQFEAPFMPCVEIGWRLAAEYWGQGYATEAARAALAFGFERCGLHEVVSFTSPANVRSLRVMERIGMLRDPEGDFDHPRIPQGHPLRRHVLYRIRAPRG